VGFTNVGGLISALPYIAAAVGMVLIGAARSHQRTIRARCVPTTIGAIGFVATALKAHSAMPLRWPRSAITALAVPSGPAGKFLTSGAGGAGIALINAMGAVSGFMIHCVGYLKIPRAFSEAIVPRAGILPIAGVLLPVTPRQAS
jgi:hypothetical protein